MANKGIAALRQFTLGKGKSGGRNSQGRITAFHRGGGAKRLLRRIDLKRSTHGVGVVERIEYDPNRSSKIALVRWVEGGTPPRRQEGREAAVEREVASLRKKVLGSSTAASDGGQFSISSLPGTVDHSSAADVFSSALSSFPKAAEAAAAASRPFGGSAGLPRIAAAGAKPTFFASRVRDENGEGAFSLGEIREWRPDLPIWAHRIKRRAAVSWQCVRRHSTFEMVGGARHGEGKPKVDRDIISQLGISSTIDLPQVAVVGSQSTGKRLSVAASAARQSGRRGKGLVRLSRRPGGARSDRGGGGRHVTVGNATPRPVALGEPQAKSLGRLSLPLFWLSSPFLLPSEEERLPLSSSLTVRLVVAPTARAERGAASWERGGGDRAWRRPPLEKLSPCSPPHGVLDCSVWGTPGMEHPAVGLPADVATAERVATSVEASPRSVATLSRGGWPSR
ncbi:hypothetical protein Taro_051942 [Colocasia esculenta]|uniref:60S ribosomal protein L2, mitochondrial n=1 Tax=Colocasia esculenta TaxID=4460 RepID=A0A843XHA0_COLES|nr:hypothetical protein [Colocasia esculenta]